MSFGGNGGASGNGGPPNGNGGPGGSGGASGTGTVTARGRDWPSVRQFNVFLENRVGALLDLVRRFETTKVRIISISIIDTADCAIIRLVLSDPERAYEILQQGKFMYTESDLLVVQLPQGEQPFLKICKTLLAAEINVHYAYPLLVGPQGHPALLLHCEDLEGAVQTLTNKGLTIFTERDLQHDDE
ncbi:MAG: acetolactate synthase [Gemmataceae bacterium]